jgi:hypothetical protein
VHNVSEPADFRGGGTFRCDHDYVHAKYKRLRADFLPARIVVSPDPADSPKLDSVARESNGLAGSVCPFSSSDKATLVDPCR